MNSLRPGRMTFLTGVLLVVTPPSSAQVSVGINTLQNAGGFRRDVGKQFTFVCPANDGAKATLYGTDTYKDDSPICAAAIHAAVLKPGRAGAVTILVGSGAKSFRGSEQNGVVSHDYGAWGHSYSFVRDGEPGTISWWTTWDPWRQIPADFATPVAVGCPAGGSTEKPIWGTDLYQIESSICVAAVHAGLISPKSGGVVSVSPVPGPGKEFTASERFGVASRNWSAQPVGFALAAATSVTPPPSSPPAPPPASIAPRKLTLSGFAASGGAAGNVAPRKLTLSGFAASGGATGNVAPRTIQTTGWNAAGSQGN